MMNIKIESTTPEEAIFEDMIEEDNDQDDTGEEDDNNIFKEEEELTNEHTNKQDEIEKQDEQHFGLANDLELTFNKKQVFSWIQMCGLQTSNHITPQGWHDWYTKNHVRSNLGQWNKTQGSFEGKYQGNDV